MCESHVVIPGFFGDEVSMDVDEWPDLLWSAVYEVTGPFSGCEGHSAGVAGLGVEPFNGGNGCFGRDELSFGGFCTAEEFGGKWSESEAEPDDSK